MIWRLGAALCCFSVSLSFQAAPVAVALNDTSTNATGCGLAAGHDATGNTINCGYPSEKIEPMAADVHEILSLLKTLAADQKTAAANPNAGETSNPEISLEQIEREYPLGFALFYSDGRNINYSIKQSSGSGVTFDPSGLEVTREGDYYCMNKMPALIRGKSLGVFSHVCVAGTQHFARVNDVMIDVKSLKASGAQAAWIIGAYQKTSD
jgi:hypothetical protein